MTGQNPPYGSGGTYQDFDSQSGNYAIHMLDGTGGQTSTSPQGGGGGGDWIGAIIGLGTALYSSYQQRRMMEQQNQWNKENAQAAYDRDVAFWHQQNAYNSPLSQMQRWKDAGLNPNLIYGGSSSGGNATSMPRAPIPEVHGVPGLLQNLPSMIGQFQDLRLKQAQIDNVKAQTDNVQSRTFNESLRGNLLDITGMSIRRRADRDDMRLNYEKAKWLQEYEFREQMQPWNVRKIRSEVNRNEQMLPYQMEGVQAGTMLSRARRDMTIRQLAMMPQQEMLNKLRIDAMRQNLTTGELNQEKIIAETILREYMSRSQQYLKPDTSNPEVPGTEIATAIARALGAMF